MFQKFVCVCLLGVLIGGGPIFAQQPSQSGDQKIVQSNERMSRVLQQEAGKDRPNWDNVEEVVVASAREWKQVARQSAQQAAAGEGIENHTIVPQIGLYVVTPVGAIAFGVGVWYWRTAFWAKALTVVGAITTVTGLAMGYFNYSDNVHIIQPMEGRLRNQIRREFDQAKLMYVQLCQTADLVRERQGRDLEEQRFLNAACPYVRNTQFQFAEPSNG